MIRTRERRLFSDCDNEVIESNESVRVTGRTAEMRVEQSAAVADCSDERRVKSGSSNDAGERGERDKGVSKEGRRVIVRVRMRMRGPTNKGEG